jgi:hypothetical protein
MREDFRELAGELAVKQQEQQALEHFSYLVRDFMPVDAAPASFSELYSAVNRAGLNWLTCFVEMLQNTEAQVLPPERTPELDAQVEAWEVLHHPEWHAEEVEIAKWKARDKALKARGIWPAGVRPPDWESYLE